MTEDGAPAPRIAAIIPCFNEEDSVALVVRDLRAALPHAQVLVYDNASTDATARVAAEAGAIVRSERRRGKGNVVRRAFADVDADVYLLIDGDDTYDASQAATLVDTLLSGPYDHVLGVRTATSATAYRRGHAAGNRLLNRITGWIFREPVSDMLSAYRVFSRRFVKSFPAQSREFEIETELTIHAMSLRIPQVEVPVGFRERGLGGASKLRTWRDGFRILWKILALAHHVRPGMVYSAASVLVGLLSLALGLPVVFEFFATGLVPRFPTAILASSLAAIAVLGLVVGLLQAAVKRARDENARLWYLSLPAPFRVAPPETPAS